MITLLQNYLAINTSYPNPDYRSAINLFKNQALRDGFLMNEVGLPSGNSVLVITLQGTCVELPALALNHHMDVVPADNVEEWLFPPFMGTIENDVVYGRGAQDCKGLGVAQYAALQQFKNNYPQQKRTIHFIMVPDEERGGYHGSKEFVQHSIFDSLNIGYVLDEGMPSGNHKEILIKIAERTPIQIEVTSVGKPGHASGLFHENCAHNLVVFLAEMVEIQAQTKNISKDNPGDFISMQITSLTTNNSALNVISSCARATIDIRIPSSMSYDQGLAFIDSMIQKYVHIRYKVLATSEERFHPISSDSYFYQILAKAIVDEKLDPKPFAFEATTDARFYSHKGVQAIGITPFSSVPNLHGINESITTQDLAQATKIFSNFLRMFCL